MFAQREDGTAIVIEGTSAAEPRAESTTVDARRAPVLRYVGFIIGLPGQEHIFRHHGSSLVIR
jgi:hypothetical protein